MIIKAPVDRRDIDLPCFALAGVQDAQPRHEAQLDRLLGQREGARNNRLARDDRGENDQEDDRKAQLRQAASGRTDP
jgi:hypothetical protein